MEKAAKLEKIVEILLKMEDVPGKKVLDFFVIIGYNNFCAVEETVQDKKNHIYARLAQLEEHLTLNQGVQGSSPWRRTESTVFDDCEHRGRCFFCGFFR